jgi:flavin-dependent dehydrogenase
MLRRVAGTRGLLVGDAAGAPSPLTAGGLDPCFRLSTVAAETIVDHLVRDDQRLCDRFRSRFTWRFLMRRLLTAFDDPRLIEVVCLSLRVFPAKSIARTVLFGAHSFPDEPGDVQAAARLARPRHGETCLTPDESALTSR